MMIPSFGKNVEKRSNHTLLPGVHVCANLPWGILVVFITAVNTLVAFDERTLPGIHPKEIIRES